MIENYDPILKTDDPVVIAAGWKPGWSTDYDAVLLCKEHKIRTLFNLSNVDSVFDKNPHEFKDAKPITRLSWSEYRQLISNEWSPGLHAPFDPIASELAQKIGLRTVILNGNNFENLENCFNGLDFTGTVIL